MQHIVIETRYIIYVPVTFAGAKRLVEHLHKKGVPIALATSSSNDSVEKKMQKHQDILKLFHHLTMGSTDPEVTKGKPDPAIFLVCASRFPEKPKPEEVSTDNFVIIELFMILFTISKTRRRSIGHSKLIKFTIVSK